MSENYKEYTKMTKEIYESVEKRAEAHWHFLEKWLHVIYIDAFIHGYSHGKNIKGD
jgi:hypothetical protein